MLLRPREDSPHKQIICSCVSLRRVWEVAVTGCDALTESVLCILRRVALPAWRFLNPLPLRKPRNLEHCLLASLSLDCWWSPQQYRYFSVLRAGHLMGTFNLENHIFDAGKFSCSCHFCFAITPLMWAFVLST